MRHGEPREGLPRDWALLVLAALVTLAVLAAPAFAQAQEPPSALASSLQALLALVVVIAVIFALAWVARRLSAGSAHGGLVRVRSAAAVGARERVVVVEVGETWLVLGVASGSVRLLHTLPRGEAPEPVGEAGSFVARLTQARTKYER